VTAEIKIPTVDGDVEVDDFLDDTATLPIALPADIEPTPGLLRLLSDIQYQTMERIASYLESEDEKVRGRRSAVLMNRRAAGIAAAAEVRSGAWTRAA
jgi:hypothetical protein